MKKVSFFILIWLLLSFLLAKPTKASIIVLKNSGEIIWNVLAYDSLAEIEIPSPSSLEIKDITNQESGFKTSISLKKEDGRISMLISGGNDTKLLDVTDFKEDLIEVEERGEAKKVLIGVKDGKFSLEQEGILVLTEFPINIDAATSKFSVTTPSGEKFLAVFPFEASQSVLRAKVISKINSANVNLVEEIDRNLSYLIPGEKIINLFNIYSLNVPLSAKVSASTGEILFINQPAWLRVLGFLFS